MQDQNKNFSNWLDDHKENLPKDFWESVEPHIPVYRKKRRIIIFFWLGLAVMLVGILTYFVGESIHNNNNAESKNNDSNTTQVTTMIGKETTQTNKSELSKDRSSKSDLLPTINANKQTGATLNNETFRRIGKTKIVSRSTKTIQKKAYQDTTILKKNTTFDFLQFDTNFENVIVASQAKNLALNKNDSQSEQFSKTNSLLQFLPLINFVPIQKRDNIMIDQKIKQIKSSQKSHFFKADIGYSMLFLHRSMRSLISNNQVFENRQQFDRDYISHELYGDLKYHIHPRWSIGGGLRYTRVQELFDYDYQFIEGNALKTTVKKRIVKHTNTIGLVDIYAQIGYNFKVSNIRFVLSDNIAYNTILNDKGIYLNEASILGKLENEHFYKSSIGWSNETSLGTQFSIYNNITLAIKGGYRHYFQAWSTTDANMDIRYKGFVVGSSVRYRF
jgi:hypothetical protein